MNKSRGARTKLRIIARRGFTSESATDPRAGNRRKAGRRYNG